MCLACSYETDTSNLFDSTALPFGTFFPGQVELFGYDDLLATLDDEINEFIVSCLDPLYNIISEFCPPPKFHPGYLRPDLKLRYAVNNGEICYTNRLKSVLIVSLLLVKNRPGSGLHHAAGFKSAKDVLQRTKVCH